MKILRLVLAAMNLFLIAAGFIVAFTPQPEWAVFLLGMITMGCIIMLVHFWRGNERK
jgi:hypothetical protein